MELLSWCTMVCTVRWYKVYAPISNFRKTVVPTDLRIINYENLTSSIKSQLGFYFIIDKITMFVFFFYSPWSTRYPYLPKGEFTQKNEG